MTLKKTLTVLAVVFPLFSYAADSGWTEEYQSRMVSGCVDSIKENVVANYKQQAGLSESDPLPPEVQTGLDQEIVPELEKTCTCTIDRVVAEHSYVEVEKDLSILQRAGASIGTPEGCPLNL